MVPCPEIMITSGGLSSSRIFCSVSSPSIPGSHTSSKTTSKACFSRSRRQVSPFSASPVRKPSSSRTPRRESRIPDSSSTIRMLDMLHGIGRRRGFGGEREFHDEARAHRLVFFHPDGPTVVFHDSADDGQSQSGSSPFGGEVGKKKLFLQFLGDAMAAVGYQNLDRIAA